MPWLDLQGPESPVRLAYDLYPGRPAAPTLVYCHGLLSIRRGPRAGMLRRWCEAAGLTSLFFDFQGRGESSGAIEDLTLSRQLQDLQAILGVLPEGSRPVLFGSSFGGLTAAWHAALHPETVRACVLVAPAFAFVPRLLDQVGVDGAERWRREGRFHFGPPIDLTVDHALVEDAADYGEERLTAGYVTPTLVFHGTEDRSVPYEESVAFCRRLGGRMVDLHLFGGGEHSLHREMDEALALLEPFLARVAP